MLKLGKVSKETRGPPGMETKIGPPGETAGSPGKLFV